MPGAAATPPPSFRYRRFRVVTGAPEAVRRAVHELLPGRSPLWVAEHPPAGVRGLQPGAVRRTLGTEEDSVVVDLREAPDPDVLASTAGLVPGGGVLVWLAPPLEAWEQELASGGGPGPPFSPFHRRLARHLREAWPDAVVEAGGASPMEAIDPPEGRGRWSSADDLGCVTTDERAVVESVLRMAEGRARRPVVVRADRGRGKSAALGLAVQALHRRRSTLRVLLITPERPGAESVLAHTGEAQACVAWRRPWDALQESPQADVVLVDEAAAVPVPILEQVLERWPRIAFASTVHGYEGTGRGFEHRFREVLDRRTPHWTLMTMDEPVRWAPGDPLEAWLYRALILDAELPGERPGEGTVAEEDAADSGFRVEPVGVEALAEDEELLRSAFGLLVGAHYRTRPRDLRELLDGEGVEVLLARNGHDAPVGVVVTRPEGGFDASLSRAIWEGRRRPRGHLVAQSLAAHGGVPEAPEARYRRIHRIAVHPEGQRRGVGQALVGAVRGRAREEGVDAVASSFGATTGLLDFWRAAGLLPVRVGSRRDPVTGEPMAMVIDGLTERGREVLRRARERLARGAVASLAEPLADVEPRLLVAVYHGVAEGRVEWPDWVEDDLRAFARAYRGYETTLPALQYLAVHELTRPGDVPRRCPGVEALIAKVLQHGSWSRVAAVAGVHGRGQLLQFLREAVAGRISDSTS